MNTTDKELRETAERVLRHVQLLKVLAHDEEHAADIALLAAHVLRPESEAEKPVTIRVTRGGEDYKSLHAIGGDHVRIDIDETDTVRRLMKMKQAVQEASRMLHAAALPDPNDEREVSLAWVRKQVHEAVNLLDAVIRA